MGMAPELVLPVYDAARSVDRGRDLHRHRRSARRPRELLFARPLQAHRPAAGARNQRRIERDVVGAVVAVAARAIAVDHVHVGGRHAERHRELVAQVVRSLRMRPHGQMALSELRHRARRTDRSVRKVGLRIGRFESARRLPGRSATLMHRARRAGQAGEELGDFALFRHHRRIRPAHMPRGKFDRLDRVLFALRSDCEKAAVAHHRSHAGQCAQRRFVDRLEHGTERLGTHDPRVQHSRQFHVVHERRTRELARDIAARSAAPDHRVARYGFGRHGSGCGACKADRRGEVPIGSPQVGARHCEDAVLLAEFARLDLEAPRGFLQEKMAHFGAREPHRRAADLDRLAARRVPLVRRAARVAGDDGQLVQRHAELFGRDLRDRGDDALPQLDLAAEHGNGFVRFEAHPLLQARIGLEAERQDGCVHFAAALRIARTMRTCVPQRHK